MVEKKFNFYNSYSFYYKSINKSLFLLESQLKVIFDDFTSFCNFEKYFENYFGNYELIKKKFIKITDFILIHTIFIRKINKYKQQVRHVKIHESNIVKKHKWITVINF